MDHNLRIDQVGVDMESEKDHHKSSLNQYRRPSIKLRSAEFEIASSAYELQSYGQQDSFCGAMISWYNSVLRYFQAFSCLFTAACLFLAPYQYFYKASSVIFYLNTVCDMIYFCVMLFRSRTSYMVDGVEEKNLLKVRRRYQTSPAFILDLITYLPLAQLLWPFSKYDGDFYALNRQTILLRLHYILFYLEFREKDSGSSTLLYRTTKYVLLSTLVIHFAACGWYGLACTRTDQTVFSLELCQQTSWIRYLPQNIFERVMSAMTDNSTVVASEVSFLHNTYITSLYWASATVTSTGYGDIHAFTVNEKVYSLFIMLVGMSVLYGMTMGGMTSMLTNIDARRSKFVHRFQAFEREVNRMDVSDEVKELCLNYFDHLWRRWEGEDVYASGFLNVLPYCLRASFAEARFSKFFNKADLLHGTEKAFVRNLSLVSKPMVYLENQFIQKSGEICDTMCYLHHGILEVLDDQETEVVALMHPGKLFGQVMMVYDLPRINSIKCRTNCDVFVLDKTDFRNVLSEYPASAAKFLKAASQKCDEVGKVWPMQPLSATTFDHSLLKAGEIRGRLKSISAFESPKPSASMLSRRLTTVHSTNYSGVDLSRVSMQKTSQDCLDQRNIQESKASLVDFIIHGNTHKTRRSSTHLEDGTTVFATTANYKEMKGVAPADAGYVDPDFMTWRGRLFKLTIVNPTGSFYSIWLDFLFAISLVAGLYATFIAFFTTTPGEQKLYTNIGNDDLYGSQILVMAKDTCNTTQNEIYNNCPTWPFNATVKCLRDAGGSFAWRISGNDSSGYQVRLPARYDISLVAYSTTTDPSRFHYWFSILLIDVPLYLNILIHFRTGVLTANGFLTSFKDIARNYNKWNRLWLDVFAVFPFEIFAPFLGCSRLVSYHAIAFLRLNRVFNFFRHVPSSFTRWEYSLNVKIIRIRTIKFMVYIYTITHVCACLFYFWSCGYITQRQLENITYKCRFGSWGWVFDISYLTSDVTDYVKTMYWASTTMTSTGYGDISASTTTGRIFALLTMIIGTVMYGWLVAIIASTVSNSEAAEVRFINSMLDTKNYLAVHLVPDALIERVMDVRVIEWKRYAGTVIPGKETIGKELSQLLHNVLFYESLNKYVACLPFFHDVDPSFVAMLCKHLQVYHYSEGDMIIYEGDLSKTLYIIKKGHCAIVSENLETQLDHLTAGDYFGECEVLFSCSSPRTVVAETACELLVLQREDIDEILECFPVLQKQMREIKEDEAYRDCVLEITKACNHVKSEEAGKVSARFHTEYFDGEFKMYTRKRKRISTLKKLTESEKSIPGSSLYSNVLSVFLLPFAFHPLSAYYIVYETIRVFLILVTAFIVPFQFAFLPRNSSLMCLQYILDGFSLLDMYIKAHTAYFNHVGVLVSHPRRTVIQYLRTSCLVDFLSWFPFELILYIRDPNITSEQQWRLLASLRFTRLLQLHKIRGYFSYWLSGIRMENRWIKAVRNILCGFVAHHLFACILFLVACPPDRFNREEQYQERTNVIILNGSGAITYCHNASWVAAVSTSDMFPSLRVVQSVLDQYIISFYWATATMVCVGYGDIHARQPVEMILATVAMVFGTVFYSFILGALAAAIQTDDMRRGMYKERLADMKKFFKVYQVNKDTQHQVLNYYSYLWDRTGGVSPNHLFAGLPPSLRTSVCQSMYGPMIREAFDEGAYVDKETQGFFRLLSTLITPALFMKKGIVCRRNDIGNEMFFIQRGSVAILDDDERTTLKVLGPGQHFGEVALLFAVPRSKTIRAVTDCELNVLTKKDLDDILDIFPQFREKMTAIAQDRKLHGARSATYEHQASLLARQFSSMHNAGVKNQTKSFLSPRVINKDSVFAFIWENTTILLGFMSGSMSIYQACFYNHTPILYVVGYFMDAWFILDMIFSYHMSFIDQFSTSVESLKIIRLHYAKSSDLFFFDAVANAPFEFIALFSPDLRLRLSLMCFARLNRMLRMYRLLCIFSNWEKDIRNNALIVRLYESLLFVGFSINFISSVWYGLACPNGSCQDETWISRGSTNYINNQVYGYQLIPWVDCLYWTVATMTSTGYGDIRPLARVEMLYACFVMVLGKLMIGYVLGMAAATLANDERLRVLYKQSVSAVKRCMIDHKFDRELYYHVVRYYEYMWMKNQGVDVTTLFPDLPFSLRADIFSQICGDMVHSMELFEGCPENFIRHLSMVMVPTAYMPGDYICIQGDVLSETFIIHRGVAEAIQDQGETKASVRLVYEGETFLCENVLRKNLIPCSLKARTYVDVFTMTMSGLQRIMKLHLAAQEIVLTNARKLYPHLNL